MILQACGGSRRHMTGPRAFKSLFFKYFSPLPVCDLPPSPCVYIGADSPLGDLFKRGQKSDSSLEVTPLAPFLSFFFQTDIHSSPAPTFGLFPPFLSLLVALVSCCLDPVLWTCHLYWIAFVQSPVYLASLYSDSSKSLCSEFPGSPSPVLPTCGVVQAPVINGTD